MSNFIYSTIRNLSRTDRKQVTLQLKQYKEDSYANQLFQLISEKNKWPKEKVRDYYQSHIHRSNYSNTQLYLSKILMRGFRDSFESRSPLNKVAALYTDAVNLIHLGNKEVARDRIQEGLELAAEIDETGFLISFEELLQTKINGVNHEYNKSIVKRISQYLKRRKIVAFLYDLLEHASKFRDGVESKDVKLLNSTLLDSQDSSLDMTGRFALLASKSLVAEIQNRLDEKIKVTDKFLEQLCSLSPNNRLQYSHVISSTFHERIIHSREKNKYREKNLELTHMIKDALSELQMSPQQRFYYDTCIFYGSFYNFQDEKIKLSEFESTLLKTERSIKDYFNRIKSNGSFTERLLRWKVFMYIAAHRMAQGKERKYKSYTRHILVNGYAITNAHKVSVRIFQLFYGIMRSDSAYCKLICRELDKEKIVDNVIRTKVLYQLITELKGLVERNEATGEIKPKELKKFTDLIHNSRPSHEVIYLLKEIINRQQL